MNGYGSKKRKVNRCRSTVSNETILTTRQEFFFTKVAPEHNWHCIIGFLITAALLNFYFILHCHLFFCKEIYFFECLYFSKYDVECRYIIFGWEYGHQLSTYATFLKKMCLSETVIFLEQDNFCRHEINVFI